MVDIGERFAGMNFISEKPASTGPGPGPGVRALRPPSQCPVSILAVDSRRSLLFNTRPLPLPPLCALLFLILPMHHECTEGPEPHLVLPGMGMGAPFHRLQVILKHPNL